jgi:hypothetical protein
MSTATEVGTATELKVPKRRNIELALLLFAIATGAFAYANVDLTLNGTLPLNFWPQVGAFAALLVALTWHAPRRSLLLSKWPCST